MEYLGVIARRKDAPDLDIASWIALVASHPNLRMNESREGINPFTREPMTFRAAPQDARVFLQDREIGSMYWAPDDSGRVVVTATDTEAVEGIATQIAETLDAEYRRGE